MKFTPLVENLRGEFLRAEEAAGEEELAVAEGFASAPEASVRLSLLGALPAAAGEVSRDLAPQAVEVRQLSVRRNTSRQGRIEQAAGRPVGPVAVLSVNTLLGRAVTTNPGGPSRPEGPPAREAHAVQRGLGAPARTPAPTAHQGRPE